MSDLFPPDIREREAALDPERSFICEAPAGSGKTELLTQRFLTLLSRVDKPEEILAITFTRKATGEMRERIILALESALGSEPEEDHKRLTWHLAKAALKQDRELAWSLLENPNRLKIQTFDSLCASLTRELPLESNFGAQPQISEDAEELYRAAVSAMLDSLEDEAPWVDALATILKLLDNDFAKFESLMVALLAGREEWLRHLGIASGGDAVRAYLENNFCTAIRDVLAAVRERIPFHCQSELLELASYAAANLRREGVSSPICHCLDADLNQKGFAGTELSDIPFWLGISVLLTTFHGNWRLSINKKFGFPAGENREEKFQCKAQIDRFLALISKLQEQKGLLEALKHLRHLPRAELDDEQWRVLSALFQLLPVLSAHLNLVFEARTSIDYAELSLAARRAMGALDEPSQLALRMDYRLQHILVDEFQDTSAGQVSLLEQLTAGWEPGDGRTLFCVGDAMQSIYGFRGANVGLFIHVREQGLKTLALEPLRLTANFRSQAGIVDWVNRVFSRAFPSVSEVSTGAVEYAESTAIQEKLEGRAATIHGFIDHSNYEMEAFYVRGIIRKTRSDNPKASIAILLRSRDYGAHILPVLKEAGLSYRAVDLEPLRDHAIIQDLMALTRALLHRADRTAWLSVLRAPWCGLNLVDLETLANSRENEKRLPSVLEQCQLVLSEKVSASTAVSDQSDFFINASNAQTRLSPDGRQRLERVLPTLQLALDNSGRRSFRQWVEGTWLALGGPAAAENSAALNNAERFFELLEQWPYAHDLQGFEQLEKKIAKLYAEPDPESDESLQVMTIHKSKGLEFDVVIIPSLQRKPRPDASAMLLWHERLNDEGERDLLMAPLTRQGKQLHPSYAYLRSEQAQKQRYEDTRLLYVACTRAKQQLHLMAFLKRDPKESARLKHPIRSSLMASIWPAVEQRIRIVEPKEAEAERLASTELFRPRPLHRLVSDWQAPELARISHLADFIPSFHYDNDEAPDTLWQSPGPRHVGSLVHRYIQKFADEGVNSWSHERIDAQSSAIERMLKSYGVPVSELMDARARVIRCLHSLIDDPTAQRILKPYAYSFSEYALTRRGKFGPENLVIDRVFKDDDGQLWIIDYKTAEPSVGQSLEEFLAIELERYTPQLRSYYRVMSELGHTQIRCALYFPLLSQLETISF